MNSAEFWTSATDGLLAVQCAVYAFILGRGLERKSLLQHRAAWPVLFVFSSLAAAAGGLVHAARSSGGTAPAWLWSTALYSVLGASFSVFAGAVGMWASPSRKKIILGLGALKTLCFAVLASRHAEFRWVLLDYATNLIAVLAASLAAFRTPGARHLAVGIAVCFAAAFVQQSSLRFSEALNHNVLYHLIQVVAFHLLFLGSHRMIFSGKGSGAG